MATKVSNFKPKLKFDILVNVENVKDVMVYILYPHSGSECRKYDAQKHHQLLITVSDFIQFPIDNFK